MSDYQLGQRVRFTEPLRREFTHDGKTGRKVWRVDPAIEAIEGVVVGKRTLANGIRHLIGYDEGISFIKEETFTAYLIAYDLRRKPVHVLPEHITVLHEPEATL